MRIQMSEVILCPRCSAPIQALVVHGHYQCPICKSNIDDCCQGEVCQTTTNEREVTDGDS